MPAPPRAARARPCNIAYDAPLPLVDPLSSPTSDIGADAPKAHRQHAEDARSFTLGPIPLRLFLDCFFAGVEFKPPTPRSSACRQFTSMPYEGTSASSLCQYMVTALNKNYKSRTLCPGFIFDIPNTPIAKQTPDICCYTGENLDIVRTAGPPQRLEAGYTELFIQLQADPNSDYFVDPPTDENDDEDADASVTHDFLFQSEDDALVRKADRRLGRHVGYATEILARQHRSFLFSISMSGSSMRFFRWDRAGCVVTESFDLRENPEFLCEFLWRFSQTSDAGRGHDMTVEVATPAEELLFKAAIRDYVQSQLDVQGDALEQAILEHYAPGRAAAMHVFPQGCAADPSSVRRYIVSRPVVAPVQLAGRGTRGYWAVDASDCRVVFVKDTWRDYETMDAWEGETLQRLRDQGVRYIPSVVCHGDLPEEPSSAPGDEYQCTATDEFRGLPEVCKVNGKIVAVYKQVHYRLVLGTVGYGLRRFKDTEELMHSTYDVFTAMQEARTKASRIHRDISLGNVILVRERGRDVRRGYLIDWEASSEVDDSGKACMPGRAGTWLFMSQRMLSHDSVNDKMTLEDDMESLLYVVLYAGLRWLPHSYPDRHLPRVFRELFEDQADFFGVPHGGLHKLANARGRATTRAVVFKDAYLHEWLNTAMDYHCPPKTLREEYEGRWSDPSFLDRYWSELLRTRQLARDDRVDHPINPPRRAASPSSVPSTAPSTPLLDRPAVDGEPQMPCSTVLGKRRVRSGEEEPERLLEHPRVKRRSTRDVARVNYTPFLQRSTRKKR